HGVPRWISRSEDSENTGLQPRAKSRTEDVAAVSAVRLYVDGERGDRRQRQKMSDRNDRIVGRGHDRGGNLHLREALRAQRVTREILLDGCKRSVSRDHVLGEREHRAEAAGAAKIVKMGEELLLASERAPPSSQEDPAIERVPIDRIDR